jgi:hypothetical protein
MFDNPAIDVVSKPFVRNASVLCSVISNMIQS